MNRESLWQKSAEIKKYAVLDKNTETENLIIGAGLAGLLTAYRLAQRGHEAIIVEAGRTGGGQSGRTTAKITSQHGLIYSRLIDDFGMVCARQYADANQWAVGEYGRIIHENNIDCDFEEQDSYIYSRIDTEKMLREANAARRLGLPASFTRENPLPFSVRGMVKFEKQAQFNPVKFMKWLAERATIYENTMVLSVEGYTAATASGLIKAKNIIFCTHFPIINVPGYYFARMHQSRSYVVAVENTKFPDGMFLGVDKGDISLRHWKNYLIVGGGDHRTGENHSGGVYDALLMKAQQFFPECTEVARWSAQDCISAAGVPLIGVYAPSRPNWYVATGFQKWGMTGAMVAAKIISDMIDGRKSHFSDVFSPRRVSISALPNVARDGVKSAVSLTKQMFSKPSKTEKKLPAGHGGIVEAGLHEKAGVYKGENSRSAVNIRCPHMGCQLEWNPDEQSWDCPCHGSRFDSQGKLLDNPAQTDLQQLDNDRPQK